MAANIVAAGHEVLVHDVRREAAAELEGAGATWAASPAEAAAGVEAVLLSLPTPPIVEEVVTGASGVFAGAAPGTTIIDLSTNSPSVVRDLAAKAAERGLAFLDAPVSGGVRGARLHTLAVMVGGDVDRFEQFRPVFEAIGANIFHVGDVGNGNVAKLVNNMLAFIGMMGTTEAIVLGAKAGIDPVVLREIVRTSSGNSFAWDGGTRAILKDKLAPTFTTTLATKDISLATALAEELGVPVPMGQRAQELLTGYRDGDFAAEDVLATVRAVEEAAGYQVRGTWHD
jgi:3-hydroxyisobutyrate dehydrogenase-like beta-hydroxyacid dehydrogenase